MLDRNRPASCRPLAGRRVGSSPGQSPRAIGSKGERQGFEVVDKGRAGGDDRPAGMTIVVRRGPDGIFDM
ncbi:hypothetical protein [Singulisphaera sp. PoT]|uniref:hypothetical protein n=1 Tax=Singulisphaera sp. PoT TaxID=3411797 RepID=UPI003BF4D20F